MGDDDLAYAVEAELAELSLRLTEPGQRECLRCYLLRMMDQFGCDGTHRWSIRWRDSRSPRARGLIRRLAQKGGCCCDCEVILNVYPYYPETPHLLPCAGVDRSGSPAPCDLTGAVRRRA
jgi:Protein of unknown function (DUF2695)